MNILLGDELDRFKAGIAPIRKAITQHPLYKSLANLEQLHIFMQHHVFAVWDFMSLLKSLQRQLTCVEVPWSPVRNTDACYLINEIVLGEECDVDPDGRRTSHYELYLNAMRQAGADTTMISGFLDSVHDTGNVDIALSKAVVPSAAAAFVENTFAFITTGKPWVQAAVFTFGREDLIPDMFHSIVDDLDGRYPGHVSLFKYYLERHIEVDGEHHSQLALDMTRSLCAGDRQRWKECEVAVQQSLQSRLALWDGVHAAIGQHPQIL